MNEYYPFGLVNQQTSSTQFGSKEQRYKYNGKELMKDFGLESEDYGARLYNPQIGRWTVIDAKAEKYQTLTPYHYAADNPVKYIDADGNEIYLCYAIRHEGNLLMQKVQYKNGELYNPDGSKFGAGNAYFNSVRDHLNNARTRSEEVSKMLSELETSNNYHEITNSNDRVSQMVGYGDPNRESANYDISFANFVRFDNGGNIINNNTITIFKNPYVDTKDPQTGHKEGAIIHELVHAWDKQTGRINFLSKRFNNQGLDFSEIKAVKYQNHILRNKKKHERMMYGDKAISLDDFEKAE